MNNQDFRPTVINDGGPWATHDMPCSVYHQTEHAVLNLNKGVFEPSWKAQKKGWKLIQVKTPLQKFILKIAGF
jgi:hypothetical protein